MQYTITKQYLRGGETTIATFQDLDDAKIFIREKLQADARLNVKVVYRIKELGETIVEFQPGMQTEDSMSSGNVSSSSKASFRPTPLNTTPRPPGTPPRWLIDEDEEKK